MDDTEAKSLTPPQEEEQSLEEALIHRLKDWIATQVPRIVSGEPTSAYKSVAIEFTVTEGDLYFLDDRETPCFSANVKETTRIDDISGWVGKRGGS